jgi:hypothetical protein
MRRGKDIGERPVAAVDTGTHIQIHVEELVR